jgi:hypothetical protein
LARRTAAVPERADAMSEVDPSTETTEQGARGAGEQAPPVEEPSGTDAPLDSEGRERPRFLLEFPNDPELQRLSQAFEAGNYQAVRVGASNLARSSEDPVVRAAAQELRRRIDPDPLMKYLLSVAIVLFVFVVWSTYQAQH